MKIIHFANNFFPASGGTATRLCELLSDTADEHILCLPQAPSIYIPGVVNELKDQDEFKGIKIRRCKLIESFKIKLPLITLFRYFEINSERLLAFAKEEDADIVHGHNPPEFAKAAIKYSRIKNAPFIYEIHTLPMDVSVVNRGRYTPGIFSYIIQKWFRLQEKKICKSADAIIVQTDVMKKRITDLFNVSGEKIKVILNGVNKDLFSPERWSTKGKELRQEKGWGDKVIFMYSGYLDYINGVDFFLDAVKELPLLVKQRIKIVIIGHGPFQRRVEDISKQEHGLVEYLGTLDYRDMPLYYSACDVFVVPRPSTLAADSLVSLKILEAMAMERVILASNVRGIDGLINDKNGFIFEKGDREDFIRKISYIVDKSKEIGHIGKQARLDVVNKYSWEKSREKLQNLYSEIRKNYPKGRACK